MNLSFSSNKFFPAIKSISYLETDAASASNLILRLTLVAWFSAKLICYKLWLSDRLFPIVPPIHLGFEVSNLVHLILLIAGLLAMLLLFIFPTKKQLFLLVLVLEIISCLLDETRWQAWVYQYLLMSVIFITNWRHKTKIIPLLSLLLSCTYIYSGISKMNGAFVQYFWQIEILQTLFHFPTHIVQHRIIHYLGYSLPGIEVVGGVLFLFKRTKKLAVILLILMHLLTLAILGPFGVNYNSSVWPWNMVMIAYLYFIGIRWNDMRYDTIITPKSLINIPIVILITIMPAFNFIDLWPHFLSFSLYSYKAKQLVISLDESAAITKTFNPYFERKRVYKWTNANSRQLILHNWAMNEMNTPPFPEEGYYVKFKEAFTAKYPMAKASFFIFESENPKIKALK